MQSQSVLLPDPSGEVQLCTILVSPSSQWKSDGVTSFFLFFSYPFVLFQLMHLQWKNEVILERELLGK